MELCFENKTVVGYAETAHLVKTVDETGESVVPDTNDDIGKIVSVQTEVFLKSKELTARGVSVSGEAESTVVYITESADNVSFVRTSKKFVIDYDIPDISEDVITQISLSVPTVRSAIVNPRKLSVSYEISGEVSVYEKTLVSTETLLPEELSERGIHVKREEREFVLVSAAAEKTFALSEQFGFPAGKPAPEKLIREKAEFCINDTQVIGTKAIARGELKIEVTYLSRDTCYPLKAEFSVPFSQIAEMGDESAELCISDAEICSQYFEVADAANGEKILNAEIHALLEIKSMRKQKCSYISDAYSNLMPSDCKRENMQLVESMQTRQVKLIADEKISIAEDCADILSIFTSPSQPVISSGEMNSGITVDVIYRSVSGELGAVRRVIGTRSDYTEEQSRILSWRLTDVYLRPEGAYVDAHAAVEVSICSIKKSQSLKAVNLLLNEEEAYDFDSFPTLTLVRCEHNDMWQYARMYHSSVEEIESINPEAENSVGKLILIPKAI